MEERNEGRRKGEMERKRRKERGEGEEAEEKGAVDRSRRDAHSDRRR
jgi:hypothetical protein